MKLNPMHIAVGRLVANMRAARPVVEQLGPISFEVGQEDGHVFIRFARPVSAMQLSGDEARQFAKLLIQSALKAGAPVPATTDQGTAA